MTTRTTAPTTAPAARSTRRAAPLVGRRLLAAGVVAATGLLAPTAASAGTPATSAHPAASSGGTTATSARHAGTTATPAGEAPSAATARQTRGPEPSGHGRAAGDDRRGRGGRTPAPEGTWAPPTDCTARIGSPVDGPLHGYRVPDRRFGHVCVGLATSALAPAGYRGDYRVQEFTDGALRASYDACHRQGSCPADATLDAYAPVSFRRTGTVASHQIDPLATDVDLTRIRRPGWFARAPYREDIGAAERATSTVEITVPAERYETDRGRRTPDQVRGWYLRGAGVPDARGRRHRALAVIIGGRTVETTAAQDPRDPAFTRTGGTWTAVTYPHPGSGTEAMGAREWREYLDSLWRAGFDVLTFDKRGHGISGDVTADDTFQQGLDMLRAIDAVHHGTGLRTLGPDGRVRTGAAAAGALVDPGLWRHLPIVLGGSSQGSYTTQWAMEANTHRWCEVDRPHGGPCHAPWGIPGVRGAILLASLPGFPQDAPGERALEGGRRERLGLVRYPSSEPLSHLHEWPAVFFAKGTYDEVSGPLRTFDAYLRARPATRELQLVRGAHSEVMWGQPLVDLVRRRMTAFAVRAVQGRPTLQRPYRTLRDAVAASPQIEARTTRPTPVP